MSRVFPLRRERQPVTDRRKLKRIVQPGIAGRRPPQRRPHQAGGLGQHHQTRRRLVQDIQDGGQHIPEGHRPGRSHRLEPDEVVEPPINHQGVESHHFGHQAAARDHEVGHTRTVGGAADRHAPGGQKFAETWSTLRISGPEGAKPHGQGFGRQ